VSRKEVSHYKLVFMGDTQAGKTTALNRFFKNQSFEVAANNQTTRGEQRHNSYIGHFLNRIVMDTGGQESEKSKHHQGLTERDIFGGTDLIIWFLKTHKFHKLIQLWEYDTSVNNEDLKSFLIELGREIIQLKNILKSIKKFQSDSPTSLIIFLSRFDEIRQDICKDEESQIKKWVWFFKKYFEKVVLEGFPEKQYKGLFAFSSKENLFYTVEKSNGRIELINGRADLLFRQLIPKSDQIDKLFDKVENTFKNFSADRLYLRLINEDTGLDVAKPIIFNYPEEFADRTMYKKFDLISDEERIFLKGYLSNPEKNLLDLSISSIKVNFEENEPPETHYLIWKRISADLYIVIFVHFRPELDSINQDDINLTCIIKISNYLDDIINQIDDLYMIKS